MNLFNAQSKRPILQSMQNKTICGCHSCVVCHTSEMHVMNGLPDAKRLYSLLSWVRYTLVHGLRHSGNRWRHRSSRKNFYRDKQASSHSSDLYKIHTRTNLIMSRCMGQTDKHCCKTESQLRISNFVVSSVACSLNLSNIEFGQYLDRWPPGMTGHLISVSLRRCGPKTVTHRGE